MSIRYSGKSQEFLNRWKIQKISDMNPTLTQQNQSQMIAPLPTTAAAPQWTHIQPGDGVGRPREIGPLHVKRGPLQQRQPYANVTRFTESCSHAPLGFRGLQTPRLKWISISVLSNFLWQADFFLTESLDQDLIEHNKWLSDLRPAMFLK